MDASWYFLKKLAENSRCYLLIVRQTFQLKRTSCKIEPNWSEGYFARGTMKLNDFQFDEAKIDFDKTLQIEPFFTNAYGNRAFTIIRKYEFGDSRTLSKSKDVQVFATKKVEIPESEIEKICLDLSKAVELGDTNSMVLEAFEKYCNK